MRRALSERTASCAWPGVDRVLVGDQKTAGGVLFAGHFAEAREFTGAEQDAGTGTKVERSHCPLFSRSSRGGGQQLAHASTHSTAACFEAGSSPPTPSSMTSGVSSVSSAGVFPVIHSVSAELDAMAAVQPRVRKRASATRPFSKRAESRSMSPQAGLVTSTFTAGGAQFAGIARILKMVQQTLAMHSCFNYR